MAKSITTPIKISPAPGHKDPLHGLTLEAILKQLVYHYGWQEMGRRIKIRCFNCNPSLPSSLQFLRRTPWARTKVEALYVQLLRRDQAAPAKGRIVPRAPRRITPTATGLMSAGPE